MRIGIFADSHDHLENIRLAVEYFNRTACEYVVFAGDLVSTMAVPPLRKLACPFVGCFGDNEGNRTGLLGGIRIVGTLAVPPFGFRAPDGTRFIIAHRYAELKGVGGEFDVAVYAHTHRPRIHCDDLGRLHVNPGETSGWTFGRPTVAVLDTAGLQAQVIDLLRGEVIDWRQNVASKGQHGLVPRLEKA